MGLIVTSQVESWCWEGEASPGALLCFSAWPDSQHFADGDLIRPGKEWPQCMPADSLQCQRLLKPPPFPPRPPLRPPSWLGHWLLLPFITEAWTSLHVEPSLGCYSGRRLLVSDGLNDSIYLIKYSSGRGMLGMGLVSEKRRGWRACICGASMVKKSAALQESKYWFYPWKSQIIQ